MNTLDQFTRMGANQEANEYIRDGVELVKVPRVVLERALAQLTFNLRTQNAETTKVIRDVAAFLART